MKKSLTIKLLALVILAALGLYSVGASAAVIALIANMDGAQEVPQVGPPGSTQADLGGTGSASLLFDDVTNVLSWVISYSLNTGPSTVAHFHGRRLSAQTAGPGISSPTQLNIPGIPTTAAGTVSGTFDFDVDAFLGLPSEQPGQPGALTRAERIDDLLAGLWYINIHTSVFPSGEIRGQILRVPEPGTLVLFGIGSLGLVGFAVRRRRTA